MNKWKFKEYMGILAYTFCLINIIYAYHYLMKLMKYLWILKECIMISVNSEILSQNYWIVLEKFFFHSAFSQFLIPFCINDNVFYGLAGMLMSKNVNNDVQWICLHQSTFISSELYKVYEYLYLTHPRHHWDPKIPSILQCITLQLNKNKN